MTGPPSPRRLVAALLYIAAALVAVSPSTAAADSPVLGSPEYLENGVGWGTAMPVDIGNGGAPSGFLSEIIWQGWGEAVASGSGIASIYKPQGGYYGGHPRIPLRAGDLGTCPGRTELAYRSLEFRLPPWPGAPLGPWLKWSGSLDLCDYSVKDPRYDYPKRPPGLCGNIGDDYAPGDILDVTSFELGCSKARGIARKAERHVRFKLPRRCLQHGCNHKVRAFRCHWYELRPGETTIDIEFAYPVQRVACAKGDSTITWWFVLWVE